ncbi:MAG: nucleotide exchange factor GrpE [Anaerolineae bacterium]
MKRSKEATRIPVRHEGDNGEVRAEREREEQGSGVAGPPVPKEPEETPVRASRERSRPPEAPELKRPDTDESIDWRDAALRLKAEMENYRKRQKRWAEDEIEQEKARLLRRFLEVVDNLEQALSYLDPEDPAHQGVQMAYDGILSLLLREGVERIFAQGRPFDHDRHEAVAVVPADERQKEDLRVVEVMSPGYKLRDRVLRPAKVVVAKRED